MKKLIALIVVAVLATSFAFADANNTVNLTVTCPSTVVTGGNTYVESIVAGATDITFNMTWGLVGNGVGSHTTSVTGDGIAASSGNVKLTAAVATIGTWSGQNCGATATATSVGTIDAPATAIAGTYSWTVTLAVTP
ncbi:MAG: hypothetical protein ABSG15_11850 [FCB group bacterium]|jgi:hypothetical protein